MAYKSTDLSVLSYANGFTLWHFRSADALADVKYPGYFNNAAEMLEIGDMIMANVIVNDELTAGILVVTSKHRGNVHVGVLREYHQ